MTFADLVAAIDQAVAPALVVLDKAGPQWMAGPNNTVTIWKRDSSPLGFNVSLANQASQTTVTAPSGSPAAAALAQAKAMIDAAGKEAAAT